MGAPDPPKLFSLWQQARIKVAQAIGYILQNDLKRDQRINEQRDAIRSLRRDVDRLISHTKLPLEDTPSK